MGVLDWLLGRPLTFESVVPETTFAVDRDSIDPALMGFTSWPSADVMSPVAPVKRAVARQVPAVKRARDIICGTLGTIPIQVLNSDNEVTTSSLLNQPELGIPRSVTFTRLFEDLLYDGVAWWKRLGNDYRGRPTIVQRIEPSAVEIRDGEFFVNGRKVSDPHRTLIQFYSPNGPLLSDGARAIRTLLRLEQAAANQAEDPQPSGFFMPKDDTDPFEDNNEVRAFLDAVKAARQSGSTGYVPAALEYKTNQFNPEQLQMSDARQHAVLEIGRLTGIDAADLSVNVSTRTYQNAQDSRRQRINDVLGPYMTAVTDRLRMDDITPQGYEVQADYSGFLRADDKTRFENYKAGLDMGLYTLEDIAEREGVPAPVAAASPPAITVTQLPKEVAA